MKKKIISIFCIMVLIFSFSVTAYAKEEETGNNSSGGGFNISEMIDGFIGGITDFFEGIFTISEDATVFYKEPMKGFAEMASKSMGWVSSSITDGGERFFFINPVAISQSLLHIITPFAMAILGIVWALELAKKGVSLELFEVKGFIQSFATAGVALVFISLSPRIMQLLYNMINSLTKLIYSNQGMSFEIFYNALDIPAGKVTVFNLLSTLSSMSTNFIIYILLMVVVWVFILFVNVKLAMRLIKVGIMQGIAPIFFGLIGSDATKGLFKNFIINYILVCAEIFVIAVIMTTMQLAFGAWVSRVGHQPDLMVGIIIVFACCGMMLKANTFLESMISHRG